MISGKWASCSAGKPSSTRKDTVAALKRRLGIGSVSANKNGVAATNNGTEAPKGFSYLSASHPLGEHEQDPPHGSGVHTAPSHHPTPSKAVSAFSLFRLRALAEGQATVAPVVGPLEMPSLGARAAVANVTLESPRHPDLLARLSRLKGTTPAVMPAGTPPRNTPRSRTSLDKINEEELPGAVTGRSCPANEEVGPSQAVRSLKRLRDAAAMAQPPSSRRTPPAQFATTAPEAARSRLDMMRQRAYPSSPDAEGDPIQSPPEVHTQQNDHGTSRLAVLQARVAAASQSNISSGSPETIGDVLMNTGGKGRKGRGCNGAATTKEVRRPAKNKSKMRVPRGGRNASEDHTSSGKVLTEQQCAAPVSSVPTHPSSLASPPSAPVGGFRAAAANAFPPAPPSNVTVRIGGLPSPTVFMVEGSSPLAPSPPVECASSTVNSRRPINAGSKSEFTKSRSSRCVVFDTSSLLVSDPGALTLLSEKWVACIPYTVVDELDKMNKTRIPEGLNEDVRRDRDWRRHRARELRNWMTSMLTSKNSHLRVQKRDEVLDSYRTSTLCNDDAILGFGVYLKKKKERVLFITEDKFLGIKAKAELGETYNYAELRKLIGLS